SIRKRNNTWHGLVYRDQVTPLAGNTDGVSPATARSLVVEKPDPASPAERAGLQHGDLVVQIADARVNCGLDLERAMLDRPAGEHVPVVVRRSGTEQRLDLVLQTVERTLAAPTDLIWRKL